MAARDFFHQQVRNALTKDGWEITHDPLELSYGRVEVQIDLGADFLKQEMIQDAILEDDLHLIVFDPVKEEIVQWIS